MLKIDTEGHDLFVLRGVPWDRVRPAVVVCEFEDRKTIPLGYTMQDLAKVLSGHGYQVLVSEWYPIIEYGRRHRWRRLRRWPCELTDDRAWGNLIAASDVLASRVVRASKFPALRQGIRHLALKVAPRP